MSWDILAVSVANGISYGMILFLLASGLSLILGVMGIINLAHGALYMLGAYVGLTLASRGANFWLVALSSGIAIGLFGLILQRVFLARLYRRENEQVLLTLGFVYILSNVVLWVWGARAKIGEIPSLLGGSVPIGSLSFPNYRIAIIIIGLLIAAGLWWFQEKTRAGMITRAGMDNIEMTTALGINYGLVSSAIFFLGAFLGGFAGFLGTPLLAAEPEMAFPILLLSMVVVVVGGIGSVQGALLGAVIIGVIDSFGRAFFPDFAMFTIYLVLTIFLLVKPSGLLGREQRQQSAIPAAAVSIPKMGVRRAFPQAWQEKLAPYAGCIILGLILLIWPPFMPAYLKTMVTHILIFAILATSLNLVFGYTGLFSLGHAAFFGVGGYTAGLLMVRYGVESFWLVALAGILTATLVAVIFGFLALRVSGLYFLLVTLASGELLYSVAIRWRTVTGGSNGLVGIPYPDLGLPFTMNATSFYYLVFIVFVICMFSLYRLVNSPFGEALQGIRENERRMQHLGYNTWLYKYIAFIVAGLFAGVAGVLFGPFAGILVPANLGVMTSTLVMLMAIIGSDRIFFGPLLGAAVILFLQYYAGIFTPERWPLILGSVFVITVMFLRGGLSIYLVNLWNRVVYHYGSVKD